MLTKCVLASGANTGSPIYVIDMETGELRRVADLDELEALQGGVVGASTAHDHFEMEYSERAKLIGNAFHTELVRTLFAEMEPPSVAERISAIGWHAVQTDRQGDGAPRMSKQEKQLTEMSDEKLEKVFGERRT